MVRRCASILALALVPACYAGIDSDESASGAGDAGGPGNADSGNAEGGSDDDGGSDSGGPGAEPTDCQGFDSGLRRLNLREYERALGAVLGSNVEVGEGFPADDAANGFDIDASLLPVTDVWLAAHAAVAEDAVDAALVDGAPTRAAIITCATQDNACAEEILGAFALHAWRRPVDADEMTSLLELLNIATAEGEGFEAGIRLALQAILVSPNFVFKVEQERAADELVDNYEFATRLAFFLWSAPPDDALLAAAADGSLLDDEALRAQVDRMLSDEKADALTDGFASQWLTLRELEAFTPLESVYPDYDDALGEAMSEETRLTFADALASDVPLAELVASPEVLVNETLADHYGIEGVVGEEFRWVDGSDAGRYGLMTQGAILALSSHPNQSSPTRRGLWVTDRLLCTPPPPAPGDVDNALPDPAAGPEAATIREFLEEQHLAEPACRVCHVFLDPVGFALENYDGAGAFRDAYENGAPIDSSGTVDGQDVADAEGLASAVAENPRLQACVSSFAVAYAANRGRHVDDACVIEEAVGDEAVGLRTLLESIVTHPSFSKAAFAEEA